MCGFVALVIQHLMRHIAICGIPGCYYILPHYQKTARFSEKIYRTQNVCILIFCTFYDRNVSNSKGNPMRCYLECTYIGLHVYLTFMGPCIVRIFQYISNKMQRYTVYFIWKLLYMFRVAPPPIIRSENNCIYSIWYLSDRYCYLPKENPARCYRVCTYIGLHVYLTFMGPCILRIFQYISNKMQRYTVYFIWKLLYMFRVAPPPIIRSANNCIYSIWYLSDRYCYLPKENPARYYRVCTYIGLYVYLTLRVLMSYIYIWSTHS